MVDILVINGRSVYIWLLVLSPYSEAPEDSDGARSSILHEQSCQRSVLYSRPARYTSGSQTRQHASQRKHGTEDRRLWSCHESGIRGRKENVRTSLFWFCLFYIYQ